MLDQEEFIGISLFLLFSSGLFVILGAADGVFGFFFFKIHTSNKKCKSSN